MHMRRRSSYEQPSTIDVQGVLGTFKVPHADLTVEYILTYSRLDGGKTANGQLLELLVPVREAFNLDDLDFDQLLQRDLDDFRVSEEIVPYLLGQPPSGPRFFPPIVAVIVPMTSGNMDELYPPCDEEYENDQGVRLKVLKYGDVFSVKREEREDGRLAQSPVDLCIHPTNAKLVIVDGQHRAMAMLATYRSALNRWNVNPFRHFYQEITLDISELHDVHLPVCIAYFPELIQTPTLVDHDDVSTSKPLTRACRKFFIDVNKNARHPSRARQILLDDTDLVACFTRQLFNMVKNQTHTGILSLHHTEYDNPHDRTVILRPFALTDVYTLYNINRSVLLLDNERVREPMRLPSSGKHPQNNLRLQRELNLDDTLTEADKEQLGIEITDIKQNNYPRRAEEKLQQCFQEMWGKVILNCLSNLYPFSTHIKAVDSVLAKHRPYTGVTQIAHTALVEGQGLRHTLDQQQQRNRDLRNDGEESDAERAWQALEKIEGDFRKYRARLYLNLDHNPDDEHTKMVNRLFECFCSSAFQNGLLMALACLKDNLGIDNQESFVSEVDKWIARINAKFHNTEGVKTVLFDHSEPKSLRCIYKPRGGLIPSDWPFFRYLTFELLDGESDGERVIINPAKTAWRKKLYSALYNRKKKEFQSSDEDEEAENQERLEVMSYREISTAYKISLNIDEKETKSDLGNLNGNSQQSQSEMEDEE